MFKDSDPRHELWDAVGEEDGHGAAAERHCPPSGGSGESSCDELQEQWGAAGCQPPASCSPPQWSLWECGCCSRPSQGVRSCTEAGIFPWREESPPRDHHLSCWMRETEAVGRRHWCLTEQAVSGSSRTLSHPSFQSFFTAAASTRAPLCLPGVGGHTSSSESESSAGDLPLVDCTSFYYTDPTMPPGLRIYNWLSGSSQEVCHSRSLNTPAPIMSVCEASPPCRPCASSRWLSDLERKAISALLELPASPHHSPLLLPGAVEGQEETVRP